MLNLTSFSRWATVLAIALAPVLPVEPNAAWARVIEVGIVQRFGAETTDRAEIRSLPGDQLTVEFDNPDGTRTRLQTSQLILDIRPQPQNQPQVQEWVILGDHATFETAEADAQRWESRGIATEVTQPGRWQVWADRDIYNTPLLRRKLVEELQSAGNETVALESRVLSAISVVSFQIGNFRYNRSQVKISTTQQRLQVTRAGETTVYGGTMQLQPNAYGDFTIVNLVPIETYLRGVVPHEIGPSAPVAAVQAQTILARTYALRNLRRFEADNYELCATVHCQVYKGLSGTVDRADRAIATTEGLVLTYEGELIDALYSAHNGGITAPFEDNWDGEPRPYLQTRIDAMNPTWDLIQKPLDTEAAIRDFLAQQQGFNGSESAVFRWDRQSTITDLTADLNRYLKRTQHPWQSVEQIIRMAVTERSPAGRIRTFSITTDKGLLELSKTEVRSALGPPRSTLFYLDPVLDANEQLIGYRFVGGGFGHGVGLSQYSAYTLAEQGWNYAQILQFYYPGTSLQPLTDEIILYREP